MATTTFGSVGYSTWSPGGMLSPEPLLEQPIHSSVSVASGSAPTSQVGMQHAIERRLDWLEEDLGVTQRRLRDTFGVGQGKDGAAGVAGLQALAERLDSELADERRWREAYEAEMAMLEDMLHQERGKRNSELKALSVELEATMKALVGRINTGLSEESRVMRERAERTEEALNELVVRVEHGCFVQNPKFVQETSTAPSSTKVWQPSAAPKAEDVGAKKPAGDAIVDAADPIEMTTALPSVIAQLATTAPAEAQKLTNATEPLLKVWSQLQEENSRLQLRREMLVKQQTARSGSVSRDEQFTNETFLDAASPAENVPGQRFAFPTVAPTEAPVPGSTGGTPITGGVPGGCNTFRGSAKPVSPALSFRPTLGLTSAEATVATVGTSQVSVATEASTDSATSIMRQTSIGTPGQSVQTTPKVGAAARLVGGQQATHLRSRPSPVARSPVSSQNGGATATAGSRMPRGSNFGGATVACRPHSPASSPAPHLVSGAVAGRPYNPSPARPLHASTPTTFSGAAAPMAQPGYRR